MKQKIKLIIEVDKKYYEACKDAVEESYPSQIEEVIANATPVTEGDLISREALKEYVKQVEDYESAYTICAYIDNAPTVSKPYESEDK